MSLGGNIRRGTIRLARIVGAVVLLIAVVATGVGIWRARRGTVEPPAGTGVQVPLGQGTRSISLYFADDRGRELVVENREVSGTAVEGNDLVRLVVEELLRGPENEHARALFPEEAELIRVFRDPSGGLYLDFTPALAAGFEGGSSAEYFALGSLLRTLVTNVPGVSRVTLTAGGQPLATLSGHVRLTRPLVASEWR